MRKNERGYTFTPLVMFLGLWLIFAALLVWLTPLPKWAAIPLGLVAVILFLCVSDVVFNR